MEVIYGLALFSASILLVGFAARLRNAPNASKWAKSNILLQPVVFTAIAGSVFGIALLIHFAADLKTASFGITEAVLLVGIIAVNWLCWRGIRKMPVAKPVATVSSADNVPPPANADDPKLRTGRKAGQRKAA
jgi:hypothetical protein